MKTKKKIKIAVLVLATVVLVAFLASGILWLPGKGETTDEFWLSTMPYRLEDTVILQKEPGKDFKILNLADIQLGDTLDIGKRAYTEETIRRLVEETKPDLITLTGDQTWTGSQRLSVSYLVELMDSFQIPWAPVFGNHDGEGNVDKNWIADQYMKSEYCLFQKGPNNIGGVGNYIINIMEGDKIVQSLIFMDSGQGREYPDDPDGTNPLYLYADELDGGAYVLNADGTRKQAQVGDNYEFISETQIAWYEWAVTGAAVANGGEIPESIAFFHIALPEYHYAYLDWKAGGYDETVGFGEKREPVCCPKVNSGLFAVMQELGSTKNVVVGHDHINNYSVLYEGIRLTYALKTGDRCYADADLNGGTLLTVTKDGVTTEHVYITIDQ